MIEKIPYNSKTHTGVTPIDCKAIHLAIQQGEKLFIDPAGNIYDSRRVCIAKGKERVPNEQNVLDFIDMMSGQSEQKPKKRSEQKKNFDENGVVAADVSGLRE